MPEWNRRAEPEELPEWMDEPCSYEDFRACLNDLMQVNRLTLGYRPTLHFLSELVSRQKPTSPLRILDVGFGGGDALRRIDAWATRRELAVDLIGIDLNPFAARAARECHGDHAPIRWLAGDAFSFEGHVDVVISSLFTHHLPTAEIVRFLRWMEAIAQRGWFINDLERSPPAAKWFSVLAAAMRWHRFVKHDGPVSFQRSFTREDWEQMLNQAAVPSDARTIVPWRPGRLCVGRLK